MLNESSAHRTQNNLSAASPILHLPATTFHRALTNKSSVLIANDFGSICISSILSSASSARCSSRLYRTQCATIRRLVAGAPLWKGITYFLPMFLRSSFQGACIVRSRGEAQIDTRSEHQRMRQGESKTHSKEGAESQLAMNMIHTD